MCSPVEYVNEADLFHFDPHAYVAERFPASVDVAFPPSRHRLLSNHLQDYTWPSHIVAFDVLLRRKGGNHAHRRNLEIEIDSPGDLGVDGVDEYDDVVQQQQTFGELLQGMGYVEHKRFWNSWIHEDPQRAGDLVVLVHNSSVFTPVQ